MKEIKLYKSPAKLLLPLVFSCAFIWGSLWLMGAKGTPKILCWFSACCFGLAFFQALFNITDRRPQIIITKIGISDRSNHQGIIKWDYIKDAYDTNTSRQKLITIVTDENFVFTHKFDGWAKKFNNDFGTKELSLNVSYLNVRRENLLSLIHILKDKTSENREAAMNLYKDRIK
jgi:hypothetical protein